jgi:murein DD-endopeptidase MepM/ murein hydrolase activator NlpD
MTVTNRFNLPSREEATMRHWANHRTRSKVALLLLINLVTLLGGKFTTQLTTFKLELFGESLAFAKAPKKKPAKAPIGGRDRDPKRDQAYLSHVVRFGDTLSEIAASYGSSPQAIKRVNRIKDPSHLPTGQEIRIPTADALTVVESELSAKASDWALFVGVQRHLERYSHPPGKGRRGFIWPAEGTLTSLFGSRGPVMGGGSARFHAGIDISVPGGTPIVAAQEGIVVFAGYNGAYGKVIKLDHQNGYSTLYAHNSRNLVHVGQSVKVGQVVCLSGNTGRSTGPHLHFEVHKDGWPVDPLDYLH